MLEAHNINKAEVAPKTEAKAQDVFINGKSTKEYTDRDWAFKINIINITNCQEDNIKKFRSHLN